MLNFINYFKKIAPVTLRTSLVSKTRHKTTNNYLKISKNLLSSFVNVAGAESSRASCRCFNDCSKSPFTLSIRPRRRWTSFARTKSGLMYSNCWNALIDLQREREKKEKLLFCWKIRIISTRYNVVQRIAAAYAQFSKQPKPNPCSMRGESH